MDTTLTLVDALIVACMFVPIFVLIRIGNSTKRKLYKQFKTLAQKNGLNISEKEFWGNAYIGIDTAKQKLLFLRSEKDSFYDDLIDLKTIKECKVISLVRSIKIKHKKENILEKVDLQIYLTRNGTTMNSLNFYDHDRVFSENLEVMRAEKWKNIIQDQLSPQKALAMAI